MSIPVFHDEWRRHPWLLAKVLAVFVARLALGFLLIVGLMYLAPAAPHESPLLVIVGTALLWAFYLLFLRRQLRGLARSTFPGLRAVEVLILGAGMFLALFALGYLLISNAAPGSFSEVLNRFTSYYFALTVLATVGFGDITPVSTWARAVTMVQMAIDLGFVAILLKIVVGAASRSPARRRSSPDSAHGSDSGHESADAGGMDA